MDKIKHLPHEKNILTSSPSPMTNQPNKFSVRDFRCEVLVGLLVSNAWTESEIMSVSPNSDIGRYMKFSYVTDGERLCIPRWMTYPDDQVDGYINRHCDQCSAAALETFLKTSTNYTQDISMPYSLCVIEKILGHEWVVTRFISDYVAKKIHKWVHDKVILNKTSFVELLKNPFSHGLFGGIFEDWMQTALGFFMEATIWNLLFQEFNPTHGAGKRLARFFSLKFTLKTRYPISLMVLFLPQSMVTESMMIISY